MAQRDYFFRFMILKNDKLINKKKKKGLKKTTGSSHLSYMV